jgi:hypothetical protein
MKQLTWFSYVFRSFSVVKLYANIPLVQGGSSILTGNVYKDIWWVPEWKWFRPSVAARLRADARWGLSGGALAWPCLSEWARMTASHQNFIPNPPEKCLVAFAVFIPELSL